MWGSTGHSRSYRPHWSESDSENERERESEKEETTLDDVENLDLT
jgi:hypothetical protein